MSWVVELADEFEPEYENLPNEAQDELLAMTRLLHRFGPQLKRPHADTMNGSRHANMKELRFHAADGIWCIAFAFESTAQSGFARRRRQIRSQRKEILSWVDQEGG